MKIIIMLFYLPHIQPNFLKYYEELDIEINSLPFALRDLFKKEEYLHSFDADYNQIVNFINRNN